MSTLPAEDSLIHSDLCNTHHGAKRAKGIGGNTGQDLLWPADTSRIALTESAQLFRTANRPD